jgi:tripartite ATP-independent transporter DctP family solute receptor
MRLTHVGGAETNFGKAALRFQELVSGETGGQVRVELYPDLAPAGGDNLAALRQLSDGEIEATLHSNLIYGNLVPRMEAFSLPYVMADRERAHAVVDSQIGADLLAELEDVGIVGLAYGENGFRQLSNNQRQVLHPQDLQGLRIRVPETHLYQAAMEALGAEPVSMTFNDLRAAIEAGTVDGQENPLSIIHSTGLYQVQPYATIWDYSWDTVVLGVHQEYWDGLPGALKSGVERAAREAMLYMRQLAEEDDLRLAEELRSLGMAVTVLTPEQKTPFVEAMASLYSTEGERLGRELVAAVRELGAGG